MAGLSFRDRLSIAVDSLFARGPFGGPGTKAPAGQVIPWGAYGQAKTPDTRLEPMVKAGWRRNELIFACVSTKAMTTSQVTLNVINRKSGTVIEDHPLRRLIKAPNPFMTESEFWAAVLILLDFAGNVYFEKVRSAAGRTVQLWPLRPDWMRIAESDDGRGEVVGYWYCVPSKEPRFLPAVDVLTFKLFDPIDSYFGYPPVAVCARSGDLDNSVTDYLRLLFEEGGVPPGILTSTQSINETVATQIRDMWMMRYGGSRNWTKGPAVLGNDTKYQATGLGVKEMGMDVLDRRSEGRICLTLKVPAVIVGTTFGLERATLNNVTGYQKNWWQNILMPIYTSFIDKLEQQLLIEYPENIGLAWDFGHVPALQDDVNEKRKRALEAFGKGAITRNQFNAEWGLPDLGPAGDVYVISSLYVTTPLQVTAPAPSKQLKRGEISPRMAELKAMPHEEKRGTYEKKLKTATLDFFGDEMKRIEQNLRSILGRKAKQSKQHPTDPLFWQEEGKILYSALFEIIVDATRAAAKDAFSSLTMDIGLSWDMINEQAVGWAATHTETVVGEISKTSMAGFLKEFDPWLQSGEPLEVLIKNLEPYYGEQRAEWVGVSETTRAFANGNINTWKQMSGFVESFDVVTAEDELVCPICTGQQDANPHGLDDPRPSFHVKCRCAVRPNIKQ